MKVKKYVWKLDFIVFLTIYIINTYLSFQNTSVLENIIS